MLWGDVKILNILREMSFKKDVNPICWNDFEMLSTIKWSKDSKWSGRNLVSETVIFLLATHWRNPLDAQSYSVTPDPHTFTNLPVAITCASSGAWCSASVVPVTLTCSDCSLNGTLVTSFKNLKNFFGHVVQDLSSREIFWTCGPKVGSL